FKIQIEPGTASKAIIGNVNVINRGGRGTADSSIQLSYTLGADATTSVRILGANGREVMTLSRGRADRAGQNEVVWNLRDQANRAVAPGTYRAEILAEGADGERVRKITPIIVTR
ncbi:MAG TPA: FlgD immunoglobulin-like domain containing protein, partial [Fimbriimonas sp.]|nr:FlgD immunoglobulin-like domain containing protein [Fimbriimonas sp.]